MSAERIRPAASLVLVRRDRFRDLRILVGQRNGRAVFMPSRFVFPGGAVDPDDRMPPPLPLSESCARRLGAEAPRLLGAACRELVEETGLRLDPAAAPLRFVFRAITPPGNVRRYDARFFMAEASALDSDPDDFSHASGELGRLHWARPEEAQRLNLAAITRAVLDEVIRLARGGVQGDVPFYDGNGDGAEDSPERGRPVLRRIP